MMAARNYSSIARSTTLTAGITGATTLISVTETTGFPTPPFTGVLDPGRGVEEIVTVTGAVGLNLTCVRGVDGSSAQPHDAGATFRHMATARDFREPAEHIALTEGAHGVTGEVAGRTMSQNLDNKTFTPEGVDHVPVKLKAGPSQAALMMEFTSPTNVALGGVRTNGRILTPGIDGTRTSTFSAQLATDIPLISRGAALQTGNLASFRNSGSTELSFVGPTGVFNAPAFVGPLGTLETVDAQDLTVADSATFRTDVADGIPVTVRSPSGHLSPSLMVTNNAGTRVAGIGGEIAEWQLFHGGSVQNIVPLKQHAGIINVVLLNGESSRIASVSLASFAFDVIPIVTTGIRNVSASASERRSGVEITDLSISSVSFRVYLPEGNVASGSTTFNVYWHAIQMTPTVAAG